MARDDVVETKYIIAYIIAILLITWVVEIFVFPGAAIAQSVLLIAFFPALAAFAFNVVQRKPARAQLKTLTHRITGKSVVFAAAYPLLFIFAGSVIVLITGMGHVSAEGLSNKLNVNSLILSLVLIIVVFLLSFGEEYGWRGYLLPAFTQKRGKIVATVIVGIVWGLWHIPIYYQGAVIAGINPPALTVFDVGWIVTFAFAFSYCYYLTENILPCMLLHSVWDITLPTVFGQGGSGIIEINGLYLSSLLLVMGVALIPWFITRFNKMDAKSLRDEGAAVTRT